ncbi:hypothetical protein NDU88_005034 [Pleurodeles waltl]|uniref:Uncharacterized protein n=1 Tax=Pleurodeles waltl TaxID=8319 RepID=A0AAV7TUC3_PLEWA|nr:hypothetical protein NDU88_005034 [Pleurodeles waltl]
MVFLRAASPIRTLLPGWRAAVPARQPRPRVSTGSGGVAPGVLVFLRVYPHLKQECRRHADPAAGLAAERCTSMAPHGMPGSGGDDVCSGHQTRPLEAMGGPQERKTALPLGEEQLLDAPLRLTVVPDVQPYLRNLDATLRLNLY